MADKAVLSALSSLCNNSIRYVDLVQFTYMNRSKKLYLAVGSHALFLVRRDWSRVITGGEILYSLLKNVVDDANNDMNLVLFLDSSELKKKQNKAWIASEPITITTIGKELLLQWLEVAWCTDFMLRRGRIGSFPRYLAKMTDDDEEPKSTQFPIARPFINTQLVSASKEKNTKQENADREREREKGKGRTQGRKKRMKDDRGEPEKAQSIPQLRL